MIAIAFYEEEFFFFPTFFYRVDEEGYSAFHIAWMSWGIMLLVMGSFPD